MIGVHLSLESAIMRNSLAAVLLSCTLAASVSAHDHGDAQPAAAAAAATQATQFGDPIPADAVPSTLAEAVADHAAGSRDQLISGRVAQVCQKQGCWMTLSDGDLMARVMTDHKFALPKDLAGSVVVYGKLEVLDLDAKEVAHMAKDSGKPESEIASREYRIAALGVAVR